MNEITCKDPFRLKNISFSRNCDLKRTKSRKSQGRFYLGKDYF